MLLELNNICREYDVSDGAHSGVVLQDVSFAVRRGETVSIQGPSGSGKSTLLNIIGALDDPSSGTVMLNGVSLADKNPDELAVVRNSEIGFVFQLHHLLPQCTVLENVLIPVLATGQVSGEIRARAESLLEEVGLSARMNYFPGRLSGGERQRVSVVRALINNPSLLLADEPTGSLDRDGSEKLAQLLLKLNRENNIALVVVTHSARIAGMMSRRYELRDGRLIACE